MLGDTVCACRKVWYVHELLRYEFDLEFELPVQRHRTRAQPSACQRASVASRQVTYPNVAPELALPELEGKTEKMCAAPRTAVAVDGACTCSAEAGMTRALAPDP